MSFIPVIWNCSSQTVVSQVENVLVLKDDISQKSERGGREVKYQSNLAKSHLAC